MTMTPEEFLVEARKMIGTETPLKQGRYPVEFDSIRRACHMSGDTNPLFLDPEYARETKHGQVLCPPMMLRYFSGPGAWPNVSTKDLMITVPTPGERAINMGVEMEWLKQVKVGDHLSQKLRLVDVYIKPIRLDPKAFWVAQERIVSNQLGEVVYVERNLLILHRTPEQIQLAGESVPVSTGG